AKAAGFQLHLRAALVTFQRRAIVALDAEGALLDFVARTIRIVTANMELALFVNQVTVHGGATLRTPALLAQQTGFALAFHVFVGTDYFITRDQVDGGLATLLRRQ